MCNMWVVCKIDILDVSGISEVVMMIKLKIV